MAKTRGVPTRPRMGRMGRVIGAEIERVTNGFVVTGRDKDYNSRRFVTKSQKEAESLVMKLVAGKVVRK